MLEFSHVSFAYASGEQQGSLRDINLTIKAGEVVLLCGESGCGKTTLTRLINGLIPHYYEGKLCGSVTMDGKELTGQPLHETSKRVGSVFQNPRSQFFNVDTTSELAFGSENMGLPVADIVESMARTVRELNMEALMGRNIFQLSGGEKQKIACASVAVHDPPLIVLDEPTSNLDAVAIGEMRRLIDRWKRQGKTIVIAEHRLYFLRDLLDRAVVMKQGGIHRVFSREELHALSARELDRMGLRPLSLDTLTKSHAVNPGGKESLRLSRLSFAYKSAGIPALEVEHLSVSEGEVVALIGRNGAGKSTFSRCLCGLEKNAGGEVRVHVSRLDRKQRLKHCFMVMQDVNHQLFTESVLDEVLLSMQQKDERKAEEILRNLDLLHMKDSHPLSLSGGQKQRIAIAGAMASERDMILFDEPTSGLDLRHMKEVAESLCRLAGMGKTLFVITHDPELILSCCTRFLQLEQGKIVADEALDDRGAQKLIDYFVTA